MTLDEIDYETASKPVDSPKLEVCSSCAFVREESSDEWISPDDSGYEGLRTQYEGNFDHGLCPPCIDIQKAEIKAYRNRHTNS